MDRPRRFYQRHVAAELQTQSRYDTFMQMSESKSNRAIYIQLVVHRRMEGKRGSLFMLYRDLVDEVFNTKGFGDERNSLRMEVYTRMKAAQAKSDILAPAATAHT